MHILIADDHAVVRRGLREILADVFSAARFSEAGNGDQVIHVLGHSQIDVLVLDINMPGRSGLEVLSDVKHLYPRLPVIVLSVQPEEQYAVRCYVSAGLAERLAARFDESIDKPLHEQLSNREYEVLRMIASGVPLTEIAERLHVSVKTVSSYRARITEKMQMKSNAELIRYALAHKLID